MIRPEMKRWMTNILLPVSLVFSVLGIAEEDHVHEKLRAVLQGLEQAINEERYSDLAPYFSERMRVTTINQEFLASPQEIAPYFEKWFGDDGFLDKLEIHLNADVPTELYYGEDGKPAYGIARGSGDESYILSDGRSFDMKTRWTAILIPEPEGQWRILALHIGTDFLDNPILAVAESSLMVFAAGGGALGLLLGGGLMWWYMRRKRPAV